MDIASLTDHMQANRGHHYPNSVIGGNSTAVLGDVHIHGPASTDQENDERERRGAWYPQSCEWLWVIY